MPILPTQTAAAVPEKFSDQLGLSGRPRVVVAVVILLTAAAFGLRCYHLGDESLSDDELNKLQTVAEYRTNGLSGKNGEHPFLMKGLQTLSISGAEALNHAGLVPLVSQETALRFPVALIGSLTVLALFLLVSALFGNSMGIVAAALWAVEPIAVGIDRIAKEDSVVTFFFILTLYFWVKSQAAAERGEQRWIRFVWMSGIAFAAAMASKYYPFLIAIPASYYNLFQTIPSTKWRLGKIRWLQFFVVMAVAFLVFNPTILIPDTWREMLKFSTEGRIAHDAYEYLGQLYRNKLTLYFAGVPWTFYFVFVATKTSIVTLVLFLVGLPLIARKKYGDGRYLLLIWAFMWLLPYCVLGGKFTRYFAVAEPLVLVCAAAGFLGVVAWIRSATKFDGMPLNIFRVAAAALLIAIPAYDSASAEPHLRLFVNSIGERWVPSGFGFPHDEFYDAATRQVVAAFAASASKKAKVASETSGLFDFYSDEAGRTDLQFVSLSDPEEVGRLSAGDLVVIAEGRRYFSNSMYFDYLEKHGTPTAEIKLNGITAARIYKLDETAVSNINRLAAAD